MSKLRVLIVDDSAVFRKAAQDFIAGLHCVAHVECAGSGPEALTRAAELRFDVVLMNITMPGMNGLEAMSILRDRVPASRIYAVTLHDFDVYRTAAMKSGADGLISKIDFATAIRKLLTELAGGDGVDRTGL